MNLIERAKELENYFREKLNSLKPKHPCIGDVRGKGLFWAVDLVKNQTTREPFNTKHDKVNGVQTLVEKVAAEMMKNGVFLQSLISHFIIAPPLIISKEEIDIGISVFDEALSIADAFIER